jgi:hypothetical protein
MADAPEITDHHRRLGRALLAAGGVTQADIDEGIHRLRTPPGNLEKALSRAGFPTEDALIAASLGSYRIPRIDLDGYPLSADALRRFPGETAVRCRAIPVGIVGRILVVATSSIDAGKATALRSAWGDKVILALASSAAVEEALRSHYPAAFHWARSVPAVRSEDLEPQTLVAVTGRAGDLPAWWKATLVGEGPVVPPEAPDLE